MQVDHHDNNNTSILRFNALWAANFYHDSILVFSTGRSPTLYKELRKEKPLLTPNITIMSVGTEIMYGDNMIPDQGWEHELNEGWDRNVVVEEASKFPELRRQVESEQRPHKVSFYVEKNHADNVIGALSSALKEHGLKVKLIYSGGIDLDILPEGAGKGQALAYLLRKFKADGRSPASTLVCGDSGNDAELFSVPDVHGVMVGNAQEELLRWYAENGQGNPHIFRATERCAAGIIQAMQHFDFQRNISPRDKVQLLDGKYHSDEHAQVAQFIIEFHLLWERWELGKVEESEAIFKLLKDSMVCACSLIVPTGEELNAYEAIEDLRTNYGAYKGQIYQNWIDRLRIQSLANGNWVATFDRWRRTATKATCRVTTAILQSEANSGKLQWTHIHETWLKGYGDTKS
ncbi:hypothetical protein KP509_13G044300 [Ceratopteris richardii]|uniref:Sucrose-phosphatase n=1 Tax=Ceratopteris richardii TaxID=49495 RepID=A0A8T2TH68_CERRI|nr:hypothetical protein KP509_13G044300 [Ceratopteris richardii]